MLFILSTSRLCKLCKHSACIPRIISSAYTARPATKESALKEDPWISISPNWKSSLKSINPSVLVPPDAVLSSPLENNNVESNRKIKQKLPEPEWRAIELDYSKLHKHCLMLSKIRLTSLVVITTMGGYALAPGVFDPLTFAMCALGTGMVSATANSINQFFEVPFDSQMSRTKNRVLVRGHLTPGQAIIFAGVSGVAGLSLLYFQVNGLTAALGAANLVLYTLIYTPMKRYSICNTWVGSIVGAIPPLMGWAGCAGDILSPGAWIMSGILYAWQFPHFNALSWNLRSDYSRAGYRMMAVTNPELCRRTALRYTAVVAGLSYLAPVLDVTHWWFAALSTPLNAYFLYLAWNFNKQSDSASSRKLFRFSLIHLPALMLLLLLSKKNWSQKSNSDKQDIINASTAVDPNKNPHIVGNLAGVFATSA
ncbi:protoheme IX farnesyltransferase, mitochondrial [Microplitis mediator]|uniref:protoheme IX farnesyltransferase, mitochondrial n=1 Tax=Microplitis mediator TaxID=375433 RepID=UPI002554E41A|nr:protoheme IX farnesyltransferase, mitochondrial [Microplitis mediator]XP_057322149.1 protoheme IX farnesyltransferase, mitochondrial [Microplitis mediator]